MFLIQTRRENNIRNYDDDIVNIHGKAKDWSNYQHQFKEIESAKKECESLISSGKYKARNIRIVEIVCTFESEIKVSSNSKR